MYIITQKLFELYPTKKDFCSVYTATFYNRILSGKLPDIHSVIRKTSFSSLGYFYSDFLSDYSEVYKGYKEKEFLFKIFSMGHSIKSFSTKYNIRDETLFLALKKGVYNYCDALSVSTTFFFENEVTLINEQLNKFQIIICTGYVKLIGTENDLKTFQELFQLKFDITSRNGLKMLVFDGWVYNLIVQTKRE